MREYAFREIPAYTSRSKWSYLTVVLACTEKIGPLASGCVCVYFIRKHTHAWRATYINTFSVNNRSKHGQRGYFMPPLKSYHESKAPFFKICTFFCNIKMCALFKSHDVRSMSITKPRSGTNHSRRWNVLARYNFRTFSQQCREQMKM